jgi:penicillin-binding protein 1A
VRLLLLRLAATITVAGLVLAATGIALAPATRQIFTAGHSRETEIAFDPLDTRSYVYAADGSLLATLYDEQNRQPIPLKEVPQHVVDVVLAVEDADFFAHDGVNLRATLRALAKNVGEGGVSQGGSTVTQQLVKQSFVGNKQSVERKAKEAFLALRLEDTMTKNQILERYLNTVYFGNSAYGLQAAAETYFGIDARSLDVPQAALLAALIRAPSAYDPVKYPDKAVVRRHLALVRLAEVGGITTKDVARYDKVPMPSKVSRFLPPPDDYFVEKVKQQLLRDTRLGATKDERERAVFRGGLRIETTFDPKAQRAAIQARNDVLATLPNSDGKTFGLPADPVTGAARFGTAAVVSVEPSTGAVRAMVGGPGFTKYKYNLTTDGIGRQTGSSFKGFVLMALLENGYVPNDSVSGSSPCSFPNPGGTPDPYVVQNFAGSGGGGGTITSQTLRSSNCAFVRLGQIVGLDKVVDVARKMGITAKVDASLLSMPLGSVEVHPIEMAAAYATIPNDGIHNPSYFVDRVLDREGQVIFEHRAHANRAFSVQSARLAAEILEKNVQSGTGTRARLPGRSAAGKTGTAQDSGDAWFVGFTPQLATAVWMGSPIGRIPMRFGGRGVTGGSYPAMIWHNMMAAWHDGLPVMDFAKPEKTRGGRYLQLTRNQDPRAGTSRYRPRTTTTGGATATTSGATTSTAGATSTTAHSTSTTSCTSTTDGQGGSGCGPP